MAYDKIKTEAHGKSRWVSHTWAKVCARRRRRANDRRVVREWCKEYK